MNKPQKPKLLPPGVAAAAIAEQKLRLEVAAMQAVLGHALALVIAALHERGAVDGLAIAAQLEQDFQHPEAIRELPAVTGLAAVAATQIRAAIPESP